MKSTRFPALLIALLAAVLTPAPLRAVPPTTTLYWDTNGTTAGAGSNVSGTWGTDSFWATDNSGTSATGAYIDGANVVFVAGSQSPGGNITLSGDQTASSITFTTNRTITITGNTLTLSGAGGIVTTTTGGTVTLSSIVAGTVGLTKSGSGTLILTNGSNSYTGGTTLNQGTLQINTSGALSSGNVTLGGNTTLSLNANGATYANNFTAGNSTTIAANVTTSTITGNLAVSGTLTVVAIANRSLTISGVISGTGDLLKAGAGVSTTSVVVLSAANTYSGATRINGGVLKLAGAGTLGNTNNRLAVAANLDLNGTNQTVGSLDDNDGSNSGSIYNSATSTTSTLTVGSAGGSTSYLGTIKNNNGTGGTVALVKTGSGTLSLLGTNSYTGGTTVNAGTLNLGAADALNGASVMGTLTVNGGALTTSVAAVTINSPVALSSGSISLNGTSAGTMTLGANQNFTMSGGTLNLSLVSISSFDQIVGSGTGTFSLTGGAVLLDGVGPIFDYASTYQIFSGFASGSASGVTISGYDTTNYTASFSNAGVLSFATNSSPAPVPEPAAWAGIAGGACAAVGVFGTWRRRRRGRVLGENRAAKI